MEKLKELLSLAQNIHDAVNAIEQPSQLERDAVVRAKVLLTALQRAHEHRATEAEAAAKQTSELAKLAAEAAPAPTEPTAQ